MHPTDRQLIEFVLGEADDATRRHLEGSCPSCAARAHEYELLVQAMRADRDPEPPADWVERAVALLTVGSIRDRIRKWCRDLRDELARVVQDSASGDFAFGTRHATEDRRLLFESGGLELDLRVEPLGAGGVLTGLVSSREDAGRPVAGARFLVTTDDREIHEGETDELGELSVTVDRLRAVRLRVRAGRKVVSFEIPDDDPTT